MAKSIPNTCIQHTSQNKSWALRAFALLMTPISSVFRHVSFAKGGMKGRIRRFMRMFSSTSVGTSSAGKLALGRRTPECDIRRWGATQSSSWIAKTCIGMSIECFDKWGYLRTSSWCTYFGLPHICDKKARFRSCCGSPVPRIVIYGEETSESITIYYVTFMAPWTGQADATFRNRPGKLNVQASGFFEERCVFSRIQFTKHFIEFVFVEKNELVCSHSNLNAIVMLQTCGQRSSMVAGRKRRALAFHFPLRIWCMFYISICRGESDLGLCIMMTSALAKRMRLRSANFRFKNVFGRKIRRKSALHSCQSILLASTEVMHRSGSDSLVHFDIKNTYQISSEKSNAGARCLLPASLLERWPQVCRVKITFELLLKVVSFPHEQIR